MTESPPTATPPQILLVEDERMIRDLIVFALEDLGAQVTAVATADEGLAALDQGQWSLLLTDVQTPGDLDGLQLAWCAAQRAPNTAVIVMSGYHDRINAPMPADALFLAKPWSIEQFYRTIECQLARCATLRPAA